MHAGARIPGPDLVPIRWECVQLIIEGRIRRGATIAPGVPDLRYAITGFRMPPTHATIEGARVRFRHNVIRGPGQQPLEPGHWVLGAPVIDGRATSRLILAR